MCNIYIYIYIYIYIHTYIFIYIYLECIYMSRSCCSRRRVRACARGAGFFARVCVRASERACVRACVRAVSETHCSRTESNTNN